MMESTIQNKILQKMKEVWNKDRISQRSRNYLGIVYLCLATFTSILALGFFGAAFATDHWKHISVNRIKLEYLIKESKDPMDIKFEFNNENIYYDRVEGLFKVCFPNAEKPNGIPQNVWGQSCVTKNFGWKLNYKPNSGGKAWAALNSLTIIAFGFYFVFLGLALVMGMAGCGGVSKQKYGFTSILMGLAFVPALIGMGLFHTTNFYERNMVIDQSLDFSQTWPDILQEVTTYTYGWSFVVAWLGMFATLLASTLFSLSYMYFWVPEPIVAQKDSDNNNSSESGNSAETTLAADPVAADLVERNLFHP